MTAAERQLDRTALLAVPGILVVLLLFIYPFLHGLVLSFEPKEGGGLANYLRFFSQPFLAPGLAITFCLCFVQAFSVFPSAVLLGAPAGPTRVIAIAAYTAAFEEYDYSMASAIAMIMGAVQLIIVVAVLALRGAFYRSPAGGAKG